jgi:sec-independent protein translocase protein TatB
MFDIGWSELLVIGVVALIAIGPKELPGVLRAMGHWMGKVRRMASDFQDQFREAMREAEVADLKRQFDEASAKATAAFNSPLETAHKEVEAAFGAAEPAKIESNKIESDKVETNKIATSDPGAIEPAPLAASEPAAAPAAEALAPAGAAPAQTADSKQGGA